VVFYAGVIPMSDAALRTSVIGMPEFITRFRFAKRVTAYCQACPAYGKNWSCPPFGFDADELLARYNHVYLFGVKMAHDDKTRASADSPEKALMYSVRLMDNVNQKLLNILHSLESRYPGSRGASAGSCKICETCARTLEQPCRFPEKMRNSVESLGFDVSMISKELLGIELVWLKDSLPPYQVLVNALFTRERRDDIIEQGAAISL
jgi:predicted metal-binding protein